jgi:hypothetical protein
LGKQAENNCVISNNWRFESFGKVLEVTFLSFEHAERKNLQTLAVFTAKAALKDTEFIEKTKSSISREKAQLTKMHKGIDVLLVFSV